MQTFSVICFHGLRQSKFLCFGLHCSMSCKENCPQKIPLTVPEVKQFNYSLKWVFQSKKLEQIESTHLVNRVTRKIISGVREAADLSFQLGMLACVSACVSKAIQICTCPYTPIFDEEPTYSSLSNMKQLTTDFGKHSIIIFPTITYV